VAPGETAPEKTAPEPLRLVQRFVNSVDLESGEDELESPEALRAWLGERDLIAGGARVSSADLRRARDAREGLRALLVRNNGLRFDAAKVDRLDAVARRAGLRASMSMSSGPELVPAATGVDAAIAQLLAISLLAVADGTWERLRHARARTASGPSTTTRRTARDAGAAWTSAATRRRHARSGRAGARRTPERHGPGSRVGP